MLSHLYEKAGNDGERQGQPRMHTGLFGKLSFMPFVNKMAAQHLAKHFIVVYDEDGCHDPEMYNLTSCCSIPGLMR